MIELPTQETQIPRLEQADHTKPLFGQCSEVDYRDSGRTLRAITLEKYKEHIKVTNEVLREVGAEHTPKMMVFNKIDALTAEPNLKKILSRSYEGSITLSAVDEVGVLQLKNKIIQTVTQDMIETIIDVEYLDADKLSLVYRHARILDTQWGETVASFKVRLTKILFERYFNQPTEREENDTV